MALWVPDMFYNFYLVKSHKIANISITTETRKKQAPFFICRILEIFDLCLTKFENNQILHFKLATDF
jgi:hypothetical protein